VCDEICQTVPEVGGALRITRMTGRSLVGRVHAKIRHLLGVDKKPGLDETRLAMRRLRSEFSSAVENLTDISSRWHFRTAAITVEDGQVFFKADNGLDFVYVRGFGLRHLEFNGTNDRLELEFIEHNFEPGGVFLDVGANFGYYGLSVAQRHDTARVFCFEPGPHAYACLTTNIDRNHLDNVQAVQAAVLDEERDVRITTDTFGGDHLIDDSDRPHHAVAGVTLDAFAKRSGLQRVDYIKIDVEGAELKVLRGAQRTIRDFLPMIQLETTDGFAERFGSRSRDVFSFLAGLDFDYVFLKRADQDAGLGRFQPGSGNPEADLQVATEFFFYPSSGSPHTDFESAYSEPLKFPYI
jgi:FkbM family methyltransferase